MTFVGIPGKAETSEMQAFVRDYGVGGFEHAIDDANLWRAFGVTSQPSFAFVNDDGSIEIHQGPLGEAALADKIEALKAA